MDNPKFWIAELNTSSFEFVGTGKTRAQAVRAVLLRFQAHMTQYIERGDPLDSNGKYPYNRDGHGHKMTDCIHTRHVTLGNGYRDDEEEATI